MGRRVRNTMNNHVISSILVIFSFFLHFSFSVRRNAIGNVTYSLVNKEYNGTVANGNEDIYRFILDNLVVDDGTFRITVSSLNATEAAPLLFTARLIRGVTSWSVPFTSSEGKKYKHVSQTLCPYLNRGPKNSTTQQFFVDVSTGSTLPLAYSLKVKNDSNFVLRLGETIEVNANPAEPVITTYTFPPNEERVLIKATSDSDICATLLIQNSKCPLLGQNQGEYSGVYASMTTKAGITVEKSRIKAPYKFYVIIMVKDTNMDCNVKKGSINPFAPSNPLDFEKEDTEKVTPSVKNDRSKSVNITVVSQPRIEEYLGPVAAPVIFFGMFYAVAFIILGVSWCISEDGGKPFITYLFPKSVKSSEADDDECDGEERKEQDKLLQNPGSSDVTENIGRDDDIINHSPDPSIHSTQSDELGDGYDWLEDIDKHKDIYRLKKQLFISDLSKKSYKKLAKKFNVYYWNLLTVAVFYALPVIQLVLTYQRVVNTSGDQDICYYNFFCARPYHLLSAFNNVYSNIGYMLLGMLFVFLVMRRDRLGKQVFVKDPERAQKYGIPKHYGILYAMGTALFMEGVMSACYHVCPNYSNFQFDTAFMYMIGILGCLRLYQTRHHDVFINGHFAYAGLAAVIFTSVIGVIFRSWQFWLIFLILHLLTCFYLSCQIYYMGRVKAAFQFHWHAKGTKFRCCGKPYYKMRFVLMLFFNMMNWALAINGLVNIPRDFATYLLVIIICNGLYYVVFYVIMKLKNGEKIKLLPMVMVVLSLVSWAAAINFFMKGLTDWQKSSAESREGNRECRLFNFYDFHDLWHFLSATAMFFTFMAMLSIDDDLEYKDRSTITVF